MRRATLTLATVYFAVMAVAITFPGIIPFNRVRPLVLGLPFVFAWVLGWVAVSVGVFYLLYREFHR